jgi:hypothetical protein
MPEPAQETNPQETVQSTAAPNQNASQPVLERSPEPECATNGQKTVNAYPEHVPQFAIIHDQGAATAVLEAVAVLEPPAKRPHPRITKENARTLALKSAEVRRRNRDTAEAERLAALRPAAPEGQTDANRAAPWSEELEIVQEQITRTRKQLQDNMEPGERAQLVRALDLMLDRKRILQERPLPGSRRPAAESSRSRPGLFTAPQPEPTTPQGNAGQEQE